MQITVLLFFSFLRFCKHYSRHTKPDILFLSSKSVNSRFSTSDLWQKKYLCRFYITYIHSLLKILMTELPSKCEWSNTKCITLLRFQPPPTFLPSSHEFQWLSCYIHIELLWLITGRSYKTWLKSHHTWIQTY